MIAPKAKRRPSPFTRAQTVALASRIFVAGYAGGVGHDERWAAEALEAAEAFGRAVAKMGAP